MSKEEGIYLNIDVIQKMVRQFLIETQISKEELAEALGITVKKLKQLYSKKVPQTLIPKINLPLVKLYCKTNFVHKL